MRVVVTTVVVCLCFLFLTTTTHAQLARTYVSRVGNNLNPCTRTLPCRQINRGIDAVQPGGEVVVLDTANYQGFTVNKAVSITASPDASPAITVVSGNTAIVIDAGSSDVVNIRGITVNGLRGTQDPSFGADIESAAAVHFQDCNFLNLGIGVTAGGFPVSIKNTTFRGNGSGIQVVSTKALLEDCRFENNGTGLFVGAGGRVTAIDCLAFGNWRGFYAGTVREATDLNLERCNATNNDTGIHADAGVVVRVANSTITNNTVGLAAFGNGQIVSRTPATNTVAGNGSGEIFTGFFPAK